MKSIVDKTTREELITRIKRLDQTSHALWGKMTVYQMLKHCAQWEEMVLGKRQYKQSLFGRIVGKMALKDMLKDEPMRPNLPTVPSFKITGDGDVPTAQAEWISLILQHDQQSDFGFLHPFFGRLSGEEAGQMAYKHFDHHLRQFKV